MIEILNASTIWNERRKPAVIQVNKYGHLRFSVEAVKMFDLKKEDRLTFMIDESDNLVYFWKDKHGFPFSEIVKVKTGSRYAICCRPLVKRILHHFNKKDNISILATNNLVRGMWFLNPQKIRISKKRNNEKKV